MICITPIVFLTLAAIVLLVFAIVFLGDSKPTEANGAGAALIIVIFSLIGVGVPLLLSTSLVDVGSRWWGRD